MFLRHFCVYRGKNPHRGRKRVSQNGDFFVKKGVQALRHGKLCHLPLHKGGRGAINRGYLFTQGGKCQGKLQYIIYMRTRVKIKNFFTNYVNFCLEAEKSVYI